MAQKIGNYQIVQSIGKGGMGEVFLAKDPSCPRLVALKQILPRLAQSKTIQERFLREAKLAAELAHPSIIPIYAIFEEKEHSYYTMPYVEGETLKEILRKTREQQKGGDKLHPIGGSIPALVQIFLSVCQAIAYTHAKGIIHRDLKPENIIVGKYGEVLILDWGIADFINTPDPVIEKELDLSLYTDLTDPGKIAGTITYLPPERVRGEACSTQLDIYALGVVLYQLLTLKMPFKRTSIKEFRKIMGKEELVDPVEAAPYREIPLQLSALAKKCLAFESKERIQTVEEIITAVQAYTEGKPEWIAVETLRLESKDDWAFQENVLLAKHIAITRATNVMEWVMLMVSQLSFSGNIRIEANIQLAAGSEGVGLLFNLPEADVKKGLEEGFCLWIGSTIKLFRAHVEVMQAPGVWFQEEDFHLISLEKTNRHLRLSLDGKPLFDYLSEVPIAATHIGLIYKDTLFTLEQIKISLGSQNLMVSCLAIPDAFLASKEYSKALAEYRRIGSSFPGRAEGREGLFRAGLTLLEEAKSSKKKRAMYPLALEEFGKLHATPGAPLEYLGKALVYKACQETEEEMKCLELALLRYKHHPLFPSITEHLLFRLHESSYYDRTAAFHCALLALRYLPFVFSNPDHARLLSSLSDHLEPLPFLEETEHTLPLSLAFWLAKPLTLVEFLEKDRENALFALLELGEYPLLQGAPEIELPLLCHQGSLREGLKKLKPQPDKIFFHIARTALDRNKGGLLLPLFEKIPPSPAVDPYHIHALLLESRYREAGDLLDSYPLEERVNDRSPFYTLFGCFLFATEGEAIGVAHFASATELAHPPSTALLSYYLRGLLDIKKLFFWERIQLYRQLILFYHCTEESNEVNYFLKQLKKAQAHAHTPSDRIHSH